MSGSLPEDPYAVLGVSKDAQLPEIRSAHRKRVLKCHPDKVQDPALKAEKQNEFQRVQQAYELLSNDSEREKYDNQVRVAELRKQAAAQSKANSSAPRSSRGAPEFEVYSSPRPSHRSSPSAASPQTFSKVYYSTRSHSDEDRRRDPRVYDAEPPRATPTRRESSFAERDTRPSKRESEREREREKERERERERERKKKADRVAKEAKEEKEMRREHKKAREKQMAKELKRQAEDKRRYMTPDEDIPPPRMEKKSSSSRKYEPREASVEPDRDLGYEDFGGVDAKYRFHEETAESYINAARVNGGGAPRRSHTYHGRTPYVPSPPPPQGVASAYPSPDEDEPRRSSATTRRRGSAEVPPLAREKSYSRPSRERLDEEPIVMDARPPPGFQKSTSSAAAPANAGLSTSPPRPLPRTNTMPAETTFSRPTPGVTRAKTFTEGATPRGRTRSKMEPQAEIESEDEDIYEQERDRDRRARDRDARDRKHRSTKKHRSPDRYREEPRATHTTYSLNNEDGGAPRTKLHRTYTRRLDPESELYDPYSGARYVERPSLGVRESSYSSAYGAPPMTKFPKVRTTKIDDVQYSKYPTTTTYG